MGLAEFLQPLLHRSEGVLENAIEFQRRVDAGEIDPGDLDANLGPALPAPA